MDGAPPESGPLSGAPAISSTDNTTNKTSSPEDDNAWGYLVSTDGLFGSPLVLAQRNQSIDEQGESSKEQGQGHTIQVDGSAQSAETSISGYLIGRHPECDKIIDLPEVSNRHCILFCENRDGAQVAILEDISTNGTTLNNAPLERNNRRELESGDEISVAGSKICQFFYPTSRESAKFAQKYILEGLIGQGHFAKAHKCVERTTGKVYAAKHFTDPPSAHPKQDAARQEVGVLMSMNHPSLLRIKDLFSGDDGVFLVLEFAPEGDLFHWLVAHKRLNETDGRRIFIQLLQGLRYMHDRNLIHRDIKLENILLMDKSLNIKLADFGLAKTIGDEHFSASICGTTSYLAPEVISEESPRRYTRAVDIWASGVVLYACLGGFLPFSEELYSKDSPYPMKEQIKNGSFSYPSPHWDCVGDAALDFIDAMITVDTKWRLTVAGCLAHHWMKIGVLEGLYSNSDLECEEITWDNPSISSGSASGTGQAPTDPSLRRQKLTRQRTLLSELVNKIS